MCLIVEFCALIALAMSDARARAPQSQSEFRRLARGRRYSARDKPRPKEMGIALEPLLDSPTQHLSPPRAAISKVYNFILFLMSGWRKRNFDSHALHLHQIKKLYFQSSCEFAIRKSTAYISCVTWFELWIRSRLIFSKAWIKKNKSLKLWA